MKTRQVSYFDLFTTGVGYLNRVTEVTVEEGMPFLTVKIAALRGRAGNVKKTYFDAKVSGTQAHEWVRLLADDVAQDRKVLIRFRLSDLEGVPYTSKKETDEAQTRVSLRTRLIGVDWARVDGQVIQPERQAAA